MGPERMKMLAQADVDKFITIDVWYRLRVCALGVYNSSFVHMQHLDV
jgi:hypothetical protein